MASTYHWASAQQSDSNPTWAVVTVLLGTRQNAKEETVRKQVVSTLEKMGAPAAQPLAKAMDEEFKLAVKAQAENNLIAEQKHLDTVIIAATILGRLGNIIARDDYVTEILLAFTHESKKTTGAVHKVPREVREAAIDALGRIFAQKAVFLVLQSPNELTKEKNKEAQTAVEFLRNETQDLKKNIVPLVKDADAAKAHDLLDAARNLNRKFKLFQKLIFIMGELEPPSGKEKDLTTRIQLSLTDIENNLRIVWTSTAGKDSGKEAAAKAEQKADELCEELDDLVRRVDGWLDMNDRTRKVILTFQDVLRSVNDNPSTVLVCAAEALGRVYGNRD
ncbi:MAG TPA: hypothetical protein VE988_17030 [Gemmataceae bacterium]|nr:hypothetical protein [Gemmataceae bacterium]